MKIAEVLKESKHGKDKIIGDPEQDKIPHIVMQLNKAIDVDGNYPITFEDGEKVKIDMKYIMAFMRKYFNLKGAEDKEEMQSLAVKSEKDFFNAIYGVKPTPAPRSLYSVPPINS